MPTCHSLGPPFVSLVAGAGRCFAAGRSVVRSRFSGAPFPPARAGPAEAARFGLGVMGDPMTSPWLNRNTKSWSKM